MFTSNDRLLVVSNNPFSNEQSNGKTLLSLINNLPKKNVRQLYFNSQKPTVNGYKYFKISDIDIIKGIFSKERRGEKVDKVARINNSINKNISIKPSPFKRIIREFLWKNSWNSKNLISWLNNYKPNKVLFLAGDSVFAYDICTYIVEEFNCDLYLYITDDYIFRKKNGLLEKFRAKCIDNAIKHILLITTQIFTISSIMKKEYDKHFNTNSIILYNSVLPLYKKNICANKNVCKIIYAGNFYYGRDQQILKFFDAVNRINKENKYKRIYVDVYANTSLDNASNNYCKILPCISFKKLINKYNNANILLFVESFNKKYVEKIKYSFSTKITEYLSLKKPIFAIGPKSSGSMDAIRNVAMCAYNDNEIYKKLVLLIRSSNIQKKLSKKAYNLYLKKFSKIYLSDFWR